MKEAPYFISDACLRCGREFRNGETCLVAFGGPDAKYKDVGLTICRDCFQGERLDKILFRTVYFRGHGGMAWPRYCGTSAVTGWAKMSRLSNGTCRIGLHRGHVEVWSRESVETTGSWAKSHVGEMGYSRDFLCYGPKALGSLIEYVEEEVRFVDLSKPEPPEGLAAEVAFERFRMLDERKATELLAHYEDIFGGAPKLEDVKHGEVPEDFVRNLESLEDMFRRGKLRISEKCPTCREMMRNSGKVTGAFRSHGFEPEPKPAGRFSEALDRQTELANYWTSPEMRARLEAAIAGGLSEKGGYYQAGRVAGMILPPLLRGDTFYWSEPICGLIENASRSIPETWTLREEGLEPLHAFAWLAGPVGIPGSKIPVCAVGWFPVQRHGGQVEEFIPPYERPVLTDPNRDALCLVFFSSSPSYPVPFPRTVAFWPIMAQLREAEIEWEFEPAGGDLQSGLRVKAAIFATMVAFLEQRILLSPRFTADRASRRRIKKARQSPVSGEIRVVRLRHMAYHGEGGDRDAQWACQWIVRGHWRNQWHPSQKEHRAKWIAPYVKGPEDKPLREPGRLFAVVR